jgi:hypothetical protein
MHYAQNDDQKYLTYATVHEFSFFALLSTFFHRFLVTCCFNCYVHFAGRFLLIEMQAYWV